MNMLTTEKTKLLDKLYNLRGEDSVVLAKMEKEREIATSTKERTTAEKLSLQDKISNLTEEERVLGDEGQKLIEVLSRIKTEDYKNVIDKLRIDFNPDRIAEEVNSSLPDTIKKVQDDISSAKEELVKVEGEMNTASATIEELSIRKDEALENQARLNEYFELALNGNINITRDSITSLLEKFDFNEEERRESAKLIMFPEDALYAYDEKIKNNNQTGKSISEVFQEAKSSIDNIEEKEDTKVEEKVLSPKEVLIDLLTELGFDYLNFTSNDIEKILANYNETTLRNNVKCAKDNDMNLDIFVENAELLYDKEFESKLARLIEIGKEPFDVYLNPRVIMKYNMKGLENAIDNLISSGFDPKIVPLLAY